MARIRHLDLSLELKQFYPSKTLARTALAACEKVNPQDELIREIDLINCPFCLQSKQLKNFDFLYTKYESIHGVFKTASNYDRRKTIHFVNVDILADVPLTPLPWSLLGEELEKIKFYSFLPLRFFVYLKNFRTQTTAELLSFLFDAHRLTSISEINSMLKIDIPIFLPDREPSNFISPTKFCNPTTGKTDSGFSYLRDLREKLPSSELRPLNGDFSFEFFE